MHIDLKTVVLKYSLCIAITVLAACFNEEKVSVDKSEKVKPESLNPGQAQGELVLYGKSIKMTYSYARYKEDEHLGVCRRNIVMLITDKAIPQKTLDEELSKERPFSENKINGIHIVVHGAKFDVPLRATSIDRRNVHGFHEASLPNNCMAFGGATGEFEYRLKPGVIEGDDISSEEDPCAKTEWKYSIKFSAQLEEYKPASEIVISDKDGIIYINDVWVSGRNNLIPAIKDRLTGECANPKFSSNDPSNKPLKIIADKDANEVKLRTQIKEAGLSHLISN